MLIQRQIWRDHVRFLIASSKGSVQLELYAEKQEEFGGTAFIFGLWVEPQYRRQSVATSLLKCAEDLAMQEGHSSVCLEWYEDTTPRAILYWYMRNGYNDKAFSGKGDYVLLEKKFTPRKKQYETTTN